MHLLRSVSPHITVTNPQSSSLIPERENLLNPSQGRNASLLWGSPARDLLNWSSCHHAAFGKKNAFPLSQWFSWQFMGILEEQLAMAIADSNLLLLNTDMHEEESFVPKKLESKIFCEIHFHLGCVQHIQFSIISWWVQSMLNLTDEYCIEKWENDGCLSTLGETTQMLRFICSFFCILGKMVVAWWMVERFR